MNKGALRQQSIHRQAKTWCLSASRGVCNQYCPHLSHRLVCQAATISIRSKHLCTDSLSQPEGRKHLHNKLACHADLYIHFLSPKFMFYWVASSSDAQYFAEFKKMIRLNISNMETLPEDISATLTNVNTKSTCGLWRISLQRQLCR